MQDWLRHCFTFLFDTVSLNVLHSSILSWERQAWPCSRCHPHTLFSLSHCCNTVSSAVQQPSLLQVDNDAFRKSPEVKLVQGHYWDMFQYLRGEQHIFFIGLIKYSFTGHVTELGGSLVLHLCNVQNTKFLRHRALMWAQYKLSSPSLGLK